MTHTLTRTKCDMRIKEIIKALLYFTREQQQQNIETITELKIKRARYSQHTKAQKYWVNSTERREWVRMSETWKHTELFFIRFFHLIVVLDCCCWISFVFHSYVCCFILRWMSYKKVMCTTNTPTMAMNNNNNNNLDTSGRANELASDRRSEKARETREWENCYVDAASANAQSIATS